MQSQEFLWINTRMLEMDMSKESLHVKQINF